MAIVKTITQSNRISLPAAGEDVPRARRPGEQDKSDQYSSPKRQPAKGELFGVCGELLFLKLPFLVAHRVFAKKRIAESKNQLNVGIGGDIPIFPPFGRLRRPPYPSRTGSTPWCARLTGPPPPQRSCWARLLASLSVSLWGSGSSCRARSQPSATASAASSSDLRPCSWSSRLAFRSQAPATRVRSFIPLPLHL